MRLIKVLLFTLSLAAFIPLPAEAASPVFGSVVAIGGSASDIALDESRGLLYIANFGGNTIQVMSTANNSIASSMNVLPWPGAIALSPDAQYLLVAHFCNLSTTSSTSTSTSTSSSTTTPVATSPACSNAITSIHLADQTQQVYSLASSPLAVAFLGTGQALIVTTTNILLLDPRTGQAKLVQTIASVASSLPVPAATFPSQILQASLSASADGKTIWGVAGAASSSASSSTSSSASSSGQLVFQYTGATNTISASLFVASPSLLPRISTASDGSYAMVGWLMIGSGMYVKARYPVTLQSSNLTGSAIDSANGLVYAQFPDANQPTGPQTTLVGTATSTLPAGMLIMDADNLTFRDRISIPEDMVGRAVINSTGKTLYAISESGVMVLPVGSLNSAHRVAAAKEDLLVATSFCNRSTLSQSLTITDPGGGHTTFSLSTTQSGVTILPASGVTPATVQVLVDPTVVPGSGGTAVITLSLTSADAINQPRPVRLLVNNPDPSQRGSVINQPGTLTDILPDNPRNRVYVLRQDMNQLLVFDGGSLSVIATLRTATSPTMMAMTTDRNFLLVGHDDSQLIDVFDLRTLQSAAPILLPSSHYARSIAVSNAAILVLARNELTSTGVVDSLSIAAGNAAALPSLGPYANSVSSSAVLTSAPGGGSILLASPDGTVMLYSAPANTFVNSRHDYKSLSGAFAASDFGTFVVGNSIFDSSLVPAGFVNPSALTASGFIFVDQGGYAASAASSSSAGSLLRVFNVQTGTSAPLTTSEAPLLPTGSTATAYGLYGSGATSTRSASSFTRTIAPLPGAGSIVMLSTSGLTVLAASYPATAQPNISAIVSAADGSSSLAPGQLVSIYGQNLSAVSLAASATPLSTALGDSCLGANGIPIPLLYVSPGQINAQLPFSVTGTSTLAIHTPGGISNTYSFTVQPAAPAIFQTGTAGPQTNLALIVRDDNGQLITPTNPVHPKDTLTIYLTGMGQTSPAVPAGQAAPSSPLSYVTLKPTVSLGGAALSVSYAGLAPGEVGVYQINAVVPSSVPNGLTIPLVVSQGGIAATFNVRVVN